MTSLPLKITYLLWQLSFVTLLCHFLGVKLTKGSLILPYKLSNTITYLKIYMAAATTDWFQECIEKFCEFMIDACFGI